MVRGALSLVTAVKRLRVQHCSFPWFSPTAEDPTASFSSSEMMAKTSPCCLQSEGLDTCLSTFSAALFQPCRGCCAQPQPMPVEQSLCSQGISSPKYSRLGPASCATLPAFAGCAGFYPRSSDEGISLGSWCAHRGWQHAGRGEGR